MTEFIITQNISFLVDKTKFLCTLEELLKTFLFFMSVLAKAEQA